MGARKLTAFFANALEISGRPSEVAPDNLKEKCPEAV
jgi:hypothetical protein